MKNKQMINERGQTEAEFLAAYDSSQYRTPSVTIDILLFAIAEGQAHDYRQLPDQSLQILLIKRRDHPEIGKWATPGGFVNFDEGLIAAAQRELAEETGVADVYLEQLYTWGKPQRDPRTRIISVAYLGLAQRARMHIRAGDDAADAQWFNIEFHEVDSVQTGTTLELHLTNDSHQLHATLSNPQKVQTIVEEGWSIDSESIAFDHALLIACGLQRLRNKIEYTDIIFNLMPELFSLTELQQVYEVVLGRPLAKANFRRKIADLVVETGEKQAAVGHRPAKLYRRASARESIKEVANDL